MSPDGRSGAAQVGRWMRWAVAHARLLGMSAVAILVFGFAWLLRYNDPSGSFGGLTDDHFFYLVRGWQILFGELPVRDFVDHGAPGYFYVSAAVQALFGRGTLSELAFSTTMLALGAAVTFWLAARASGSLLFGLVGAVFHVFLAPRFYNYPKIVVYAAAIPALWAVANRQTVRRIAVVALVTAAAFLLRHDHGVFVGLGMLTLLLVLHEVPWRDRVRHGAVYGALVLALLSPYLAFIQWNGGLVSYFQGAATWAERDRGRAEVVWPGLLDSPDGVSEAAREGPPLQRFRATYRDNQVAWLYYTILVLPLIGLAFLACGRDGFRPDWPRAGEKMAVVAVLGIALNAGFLRAPLEARLADPSVPHAILVAWLGAAVVRAWWRRDRVQVRWPSHARLVRAGLTLAVVPMALVVALFLSDDTYERLDKSSLVERIGKPFERAAMITETFRDAWPVDPAVEQQGSMQLAAYLRACTARSDRIFLTPYLPQVLGMADRAFAGGHADYRAGFFQTEADQRTTIERLERQSVPLVVFRTDEVPSFRESYPLLSRYLDEHYVDAGSRTLDERTAITLFVERGREPAGTWAPLDWPCFAADI